MDFRIPLKKQSKKNQKAYYSNLRKTWDINPISRVCPNKKKEAEKNFDINEEL